MTLRPEELPVPRLPLDLLRPSLGESDHGATVAAMAPLRETLAGRVLWHVSSTPKGGGVAEMLLPLVGYLRGAGLDARWAVIEGTPDFFALTKSLHHALHGSTFDEAALDGAAARALYDDVTADNAEELIGMVRPGDVVVLHDPQTVGLAVPLSALGARVFWRCHIGADAPNRFSARGWSFLAPYLRFVDTAVFSRRAYVPSLLEDRSVIVPPAIDVLSAKNLPLTPEEVEGLLSFAGLIDAPRCGPPTIVGRDGSPVRITRQADLQLLGRPPSRDVPLVVQVSRWDPLKDPIGVMSGFCALLHRQPGVACELVLAGPSVLSVADDPEAAATYDRVLSAWRKLSHADRARVHLACLPMRSVEENALIVNALQRHAAVVVQKSLREGFGLTVTEAMWKGRPVVASAVGGIVEQIVHGESGLLLEDPADQAGFAALLLQLLGNPSVGARLGRAAHERVRALFLEGRHLRSWASLLTQPSPRAQLSAEAHRAP